MICVAECIEKLGRTRLVEIVGLLQEKNFDLAVRAKSRQDTIIRMRKSQKKLREKIIDLEKLVDAKKWGN